MKLKNFLLFFGVDPHCPPVSKKHFELIVKTAELKYGKEFKRTVLDCFQEIDYTYEWFDFIPGSWDDLRKKN